MFREKDEGDLRNEILALKRQLNNSRNENSLLKVKIRKLQEEIVKKNKHIEVLLNPKKSSAFHKVMSENGATIVMNSLERNIKLQKELDEKNVQIKKLQSDLEVARLYTTKNNNNKRAVSAKVTSNLEIEKMKIEMPIKNTTRKILQQQKSSSTTASLEGHCAYNTKEENNCLRNSGGSPDSDLDRNELFCETPHKEIQQLHKYVIDVLSEVDMLKETIAQMQGEHKNKDDQLQKLQKEMKTFKSKSADGKRKCATSYNNNKKTVNFDQSPRKPKKKVKRNSDKRNNEITAIMNCMDAIETQIQKESDSDGVY